MNFRIRLAFEAIFKKSTTLQDVNPDPEAGEELKMTPINDVTAIRETNSGMATPIGHTNLKKVQLVIN